MNTGRIILKLVLDEMGLDSSNLPLDTFSERLCMQKKVYLVQVAGLDLGYRYNWYHHGPYCPSLTQNVFTLKDEIRDEEEDYKNYDLSDRAKECIKKAKEIWEFPTDVEINESEWVELLGSIHYLKKIAYWPGGKVEKAKLVNVLLKAKPQFKDREDHIDKAWERLEKYGLLERKSLA